MSTIKSRHAGIATLVLCLLMGAALSVVVTRSSDAASVVGAAADADLRVLQEEHPTLNLSSAEEILSDAHGTVWVTHASDGQVCLIEKPLGDKWTKSRFSCRDGDIAAVEGVVAGAPGDWYGYVPKGVPSAQVTVAGLTTAVAVSTKQSFRLPDNASGVSVNGKFYELPVLGG